jgi:hypothetical protein
LKLKNPVMEQVSELFAELQASKLEGWRAKLEEFEVAKLLTE